MSASARVTVLLGALALASAAVGPVGAAPVVVVDHRVHRALQAKSAVNLLVKVQPTTPSVLEGFQAESFADRPSRIRALKQQLEAANGAALRPLMHLLRQEAAVDVEFRSFWIDTVAAIRNADAELLEKIVRLPGVIEVREEEVLGIDPIEAAPRRSTGLEAIHGPPEWGVERIGAPKVWADGTMGQNVVVGAIDTGVRATHEALAASFVGTRYGWYDPEKQAPEPYDAKGHGSHVIGTIAGSKGIGVAPAAKWMMCKACRGLEGCPQSDLIACGQFMLCPTLPDGSNPDCSKAPRIINNSWGGRQGDDWYQPIVRAWLKAGIIPVFSLGNTGPACGTAKSPGDYPNVIGVASMNSNDAMRATSSKGPTIRGRMKPDIAAPGGLIRSAWNTTDNAYNVISGTSMAAPHVSGAIALLLSQEPDLTIDEVKVRLYTTTDQKLAPSNYTCGGTTDAHWPNNQYGHGRLNVFNAYAGFRPALSG